MSASSPSAPAGTPHNRIQTVMAQKLSYDKMGLFLALIIGGIFRLYTPLTSDFPIGDGGLFFVMAQTLKANHFALPATITYPIIVDQIPMCYPPLSFYQVALFNGLGIPIETSLRLLPAFWSVASIYAFWRLARTLFQPLACAPQATAISTLLWSLRPWSLLWIIMGGGITRAPGIFWALLGIEAGIRLWRDQQKTLLWSGLYLALAVLTHLQQARFLVISLFLVALIYNRSWKSLGQLVLIGTVGILLAMPWWGLCLWRFGLSPFLASLQSGSSAWQGATLFNIILGAEFVVPFVALAGIISLWFIKRQFPLLPCWFGLILLVEVRSPHFYITIPLSLALGWLLLQIPSRTWRYSLTCFLAGWSFLQCSLVQIKYVVLPKGQRQAMAWAKTQTPPSARFLVMPSGPMRKDWASDVSAEWFPALAQRQSVMTVQGSEWLPDHAFKRLWENYSALAKTHDWAEFKKSAHQRQLNFDYLFLPKTSLGSSSVTTFLRKTEAELQQDHQFSCVFSNADASIWHYTPTRTQ